MNLSEDFDGFLPYQNSIWTDPRHWAACGFFSLHHAMVLPTCFLEVGHAARSGAPETCALETRRNHIKNT
jgi:hypothetical protein